MEGSAQETIPRPRFPAGRRHHRDTPSPVAFDPQVAIQLAELEELLPANVDDRGHVQLQGHRAGPLMEDRHDLRLPHAPRGNQRSRTAPRSAPHGGPATWHPTLDAIPSTGRTAGHGRALDTEP